MYDKREVAPSGCSDNPVLYLVLDTPSDEDCIAGEVVLPSILSDLLSDSEIDVSQVRISNLGSRKPVNDKGHYRKPDVAELQKLIQTTKEDILACKPSMIVLCGGAAISSFGLEGSINELRGRSDLTFSAIPMTVTYHMRYMENTGGRTSRSWTACIADFKGAYNIATGASLLDAEDSGYEIVDILDVEACQQMVKDFESYDKVVLDYEASGLDTYVEGFHLGGVGLTSPDKEVRRYVHFYDFWRPYRDGAIDVPEESLEALRSILTSKGVVVFNQQYESAATCSPVSLINAELNKPEDVMMWARCLATPGSLKSIASSVLGIPIWTDGIDDWNGAIEEVMKYQNMTASMVNHREEIQWLIDQGYENYFEVKGYFWQYAAGYATDALNTLIKSANLHDPEAEDKQTGITEIGYARRYLDEHTDIRDWILASGLSGKYSGRAKDTDVMDLIRTIHPKIPYWLDIKSYIDNLGSRIGNSYRAVLQMEKVCQMYLPDRMEEVGKRLRTMLIDKIEKREYSNGVAIKYSEVPLEIVAPYCDKDLTHTADLYHKVKEDLDSKGLYDTARIYDANARLAFEMEKNGIAWDESTASRLDGEYEVGTIESLRSLLLLPRMKRVLDLSPQDELEIQSATDVNVLKTHFNPLSSYKYDDPNLRTSVRLGKLMGTPRLKFALMLYAIHQEAQGYADPEEAVVEYPTLFPLYDRTVQSDPSKRTKLVDSLVLNANRLRDEIYMSRDKRQRYYTDHGGVPEEVDLNAEVDLFNTYSKWVMEGASSDVIEELYHTFKSILGVEVDDKSTWVDEFEAMYYFRLFKKISKSRGTYIHGKCGRAQVQITDPANAYQYAPTRERYYEDNLEDNRVDGSQLYLVKSSFGANTAATKRWTSFVHTVPWNCFPAGTLVKTESGPVPIELLADPDLRKGRDLEKVATYDPLNQRVSYAYPGGIFSVGEKDLIELTLESGAQIKCTPDHPFLCRGPKVTRCVGEHYRWIEAQDLVNDEELWMVDGSDRVISVREIEPAKVYCLSFGTYSYDLNNFVLESGHVVHNCELMDLRVSRYPDGLRMHYDYSQMEVRMIARIANDEPLLKAFYEGKDVHRFVASKVWGIPEEDVTDAQRRYAKMATFSILYGKSERQFGIEFMKGDIQGAEKLFSDFFTAFPGVRRYIKDMHRMALDTGTVSTLYGDPISVDMPYWALQLPKATKEILIEDLFSRQIKLHNDRRRDRAMRFEIAKALRNAQNYPIQSSSSTLAAMCIEKIADGVHEANTSGKMDCFTHDSSDCDFQIKDLISLLKIIPKIAVDYPREKYGVPADIDFELGVAGDHMVEFDAEEIGDTWVEAKIKGRQESIDMLVNKLELYNAKVDLEIKESEDDLISMEELFITRRAYAARIGKPFKKVKAVMRIDISDVTVSTPETCTELWKLNLENRERISP